MESIKLSVFNLVGGEFCTEPDDGQIVFETLSKALKQSKSVEVSFQNVEILTASFLNLAIGQLYKDFSEENIRALVKVVDIDEGNSALLRRVINTAKLYYQDPDRILTRAKKMENATSQWLVTTGTNELINGTRCLLLFEGGFYRIGIWVESEGCFREDLPIDKTRLGMKFTQPLIKFSIIF